MSISGATEIEMGASSRWVGGAVSVGDARDELVCEGERVGEEERSRSEDRRLVI
jgi:hypothetical protein